MGENTNLHPVYSIARAKREGARRDVVKFRTVHGYTLEIKDLGSLGIVITICREDEGLWLEEGFRLNPDGSCDLSVHARIMSSTFQGNVLDTYDLKESWGVSSGVVQSNVWLKKRLGGLAELIEDKRTVTTI